MHGIALSSVLISRTGSNLTIPCHMFFNGSREDGILIFLASFEVFVLLKYILLRIMRWEGSIKQAAISNTGNCRIYARVILSSLVQRLPHIYLRLGWIQMLLIGCIFPAIVALVKGMCGSIAVNAANEGVAVHLIEVHALNSVYNQMEKSMLLWTL